MKKTIKIVIPIVCAVIAVTTIILVAVFREDIFGNGIDNINKNIYGEVNPDTWTAVDGLGRTLPTNEEVGGKETRKICGYVLLDLALSSLPKSSCEKYY